MAKARADEKVGVFVRRGGRLQVVEYSEMTPQDSAATEAGELSTCCCFQALPGSLTGRTSVGWSCHTLDAPKLDWTCQSSRAPGWLQTLMLHLASTHTMSCADEWQGSAGTGELRHRWSNVCMHHFSLAFLERMAGHMEHRAPFHQAHKSIPSLHGPVKVPGQLQNVLPILIPPSQKAADAAHLQGLHWRIWAAPVPACDLAYRQL